MRPIVNNPTHPVAKEHTKRLVTKDFQRIIKKIAMLDDGKLYTLNAVPTDTNIARMQEEYPNAQILNAMTFEKGLAAYATVSGVSI